SFGEQSATEIHAARGDVRVDVDTARHHYHPARIEARRVIGERLDDAAAIDADVAHRSADPVRGVVDLAARDAKRHQRSTSAAWAHLLESSAATIAALSGQGDSPGKTGRSGNGMSSILKAIPPS